MQTRADKFWAKVQKSDGCWLWSGPLGDEPPRNYGRFIFKKQAQRAHRVAWELTHGSIPAGMSVCHRCDTPPCVNPEHLFLASHAENMKDRNSKGRCGALSREAHLQAKLTEEQVAEIRRRYIPKIVTQRQLAAEYGVSQRAVFFVLHNMHWKETRNGRV